MLHILKIPNKNMHAVLESIASELDQIANTLISAIPTDEPFYTNGNNWSFPGLTKSELADIAKGLAGHIRERGADTLGDNEARINDYLRRLVFLRNFTIPNLWGNPGAGVPTYIGTLEGLRRAVEPAMQSDDEVLQAANTLIRRIRAMDARLNEIEPRSVKLADMVERIEFAYEAADQLPTDLQALTESRDKVAKLLAAAEDDRGQVLLARSNATKLEESLALSATKLQESLASSAKDADAVLAKCDLAYAAATSQGLAAAFSERSSKLDQSMWYWVGGLVLALISGAFFGSQRLQELGELMKNPSLTPGTAVLNLLLAVLSVGAPIWFGWLATKQIGQRFRLSEDYAFKASISRAYEGYRLQASRIDKDMEASLLASALSHLDEQPLRFVEHTDHGSPWHELASSDIVKSAIRSVPGFAERVADSARDALRSLRSSTPDPKVSTKPLSTDETPTG